MIPAGDMIHRALGNISNAQVPSPRKRIIGRVVRRWMDRLSPIGLEHLGSADVRRLIMRLNTAADGNPTPFTNMVTSWPEPARSLIYNTHNSTLLDDLPGQVIAQLP